MSKRTGGFDRMGYERDQRLARQAFDAGDLQAAKQALQRMLRRRSGDLNALRGLGQIALQLRDYDQAAHWYRRCQKANPDEPGTYIAMADLQLLQGNPDAALQQLDRACELRPDDDLARLKRGVIHERLARYDEARDAIADVADDGPQRPLLLELRCTIALHEGRLQDAVDIARDAIDDTELPPATRQRLAHLKGQAHDKLDEPDDAMDAWRTAHAVVPRQFDPDAYVKMFDEMIAFFSHKTIRRMPRSSHQSQLPFFIVGMARSGTTLVEQIIDAHPLGYGAGELGDLDVLRGTVRERVGSARPFPHCLYDVNREHLNRFAGNHLERLHAMMPRGCKRVVNKSLENYRSLGFITMLFPRCRAAFCRRNPVDTCLSIYMNMFQPHSHPYAGDLAHLGLAHRQAQRLMDHWLSVLDIPMIEIEYEQLIAEPDSETRRLIEHTGLEFDDACLQPHASGRTVMTLSYHQVNRPMYRSSIGRYERYRRHLGPLLEALGLDA
jgi:tetratricopeptide (TPR) repeat protein